RTGAPTSRTSVRGVGGVVMSETCGECGAPFASAAELVEHMKTAHAEPTAIPLPEGSAAEEVQPDLTCVFCHAVFHRGEDLAAHMRATHAGEESAPALA